MASLKEMTTGELRSLQDEVSRAIRLSGEPKELIRFERAIDDELISRGA